MKILDGSLLFAAVLLAGCGTTKNVAATSYHVTRDVAVGSYRVATAPVHYALGRHGEPKIGGPTKFLSCRNSPCFGSARVSSIWGAQAASLLLSAACRQHLPDTQF